MKCEKKKERKGKVADILERGIFPSFPEIIMPQLARIGRFECNPREGGSGKWDP